jgi:hypothetical protein
VGLLDGQLAKAIYAGFKGRLLTGRLLRVAPIAADGTDEDGDAASVTPALYGLEGFDDRYSDFSRATAGIPDTDVKVCIFAASLPAGVRPLKDDKVALRRAGVDRWYQLRRDATDPAEALWECQAFELEGPPSELPSL